MSLLVQNIGLLYRINDLGYHCRIFPSRIIKARSFFEPWLSKKLPADVTARVEA
jgi:hypothetical protein